MKRRFPILLYLFVILGSVSGESFRGNVVGVFDVGPDSDSVLEMRGGDVFSFAVSPQEPYVDGFDLSIELSDEFPRIDGYFGVQFFVDVARPIQSGIANIDGRRIITVPVTGARQQFIRVPIRERGSFATRPDMTVLPVTPLTDGFTYAAQLVPLMKGMPSAAMTATVSVTVRPVRAPVGGLVVHLVPENTDQDLSEQIDAANLLLDGSPVPPEELIELNPGIYHVELYSADFVDVNENVGIEAGTVTAISLLLEPPMAAVRFSIPSTGELFIDGRRVPRGTATTELEPGEHTMLIRLGDFSVSRQVYLQPEQEYEIGVELDFFVRTD